MNEKKPNKHVIQSECMLWTMQGKEVIKKCPQVYELQDELSAARDEIEHMTALKDQRNEWLTKKNEEIDGLKAELKAEREKCSTQCETVGCDGIIDTSYCKQCLKDWQS